MLAFPSLATKIVSSQWRAEKGKEPRHAVGDKIASGLRIARPCGYKKRPIRQYSRARVAARVEEGWPDVKARARPRQQARVTCGLVNVSLRWLSKVAINKDGAPAKPRVGGRKVRGEGRLALGRERARYQDAPGYPLLGNEVDLAGEGQEGLGIIQVDIVADDVRPVLLPSATQSRKHTNHLDPETALKVDVFVDTLVKEVDRKRGAGKRSQRQKPDDGGIDGNHRHQGVMGVSGVDHSQDVSRQRGVDRRLSDPLEEVIERLALSVGLLAERVQVAGKLAQFKRIIERLVEFGVETVFRGDRDVQLGLEVGKSHLVIACQRVSGG